MPKKTDKFDLAGFADGVERALTSLPTADQKSKALADLEQLLTALQELREALSLVPTAEDQVAALAALARLRELSEQADESPVLAAALGKTVRRAPRKRSTSKSDRAAARELLDRLKALPMDAIEARLNDPALSVSMLRAVADEAGIRGNSKRPRDQLVGQITMKIVNFRGYQKLGGSSD